MKLILVNHSRDEYVELYGNGKEAVILNSELIASYMQLCMGDFICFVDDESKIYEAILMDYENKTAWALNALITCEYYLPEDIAYIMLEKDENMYKFFYEKLRMDESEFEEVLYTIINAKETLLEYRDHHIKRLGDEKKYEDVLDKIEFLASYFLRGYDDMV